MTTESEMNQVGAISRVNEWHSVEWRSVNQNVRLAASAYCQGNTGKEMEQGSGFATSFDSLAKRQTFRRKASDGKLWKENSQGLEVVKPRLAKGVNEA